MMSSLRYKFRLKCRSMVWRLQFLILKIFCRNVIQFDYNYSKNFLKNHDELCLVAPGSSAESITKFEWSQINANCDLIYVNRGCIYHRNHAGIVSFEVHENWRDQLFLFESEFSERRSIVIRGTSSIKNLFRTIEVCLFLSSRCDRLLLGIEEYAFDINRSSYLDLNGMHEVLEYSKREKRFVEFGASLLFWLNYSRIMGYSKVSLVGFDFDRSYGQVLETKENFQTGSLEFESLLESCGLYFFSKPEGVSYYVFRGKGPLKSILENRCFE